MSDTKLADLTALTTPSGDDLLYVVDDPAGTPADRKLALSDVFKRGTVTTSSPVIDAAQTWNDGAVTFTGLKFNATDTASASGSLLMDLQVGGASRFNVSKAGRISGKTDIYAPYVDLGGPTNGPVQIGRVDNGNILGIGYGNTGALTLRGDAAFGWSNSSTVTGASLDPATVLTRRGPANLRLGAADTTGTTAPTPQFLSAQSWASSTNNNQTGANFTIDGSQGTGTGAGGSIIFRVAPAGSTSNGVQNALATALTIASDRSVALDGTLVFGPTVIQNTNPDSANTLSFSIGGNRHVTVGNYRLSLGSTAFFGWSGTANQSFATVDLSLFRDAANTLAQRNGANAQAFRLYNTFTDATTFERANFFWDSNVLKIGTAKGADGGTARALEFQTDGTTRLTIAAAGVVSTSSNLSVGNDLIIPGSSAQIQLATGYGNISRGPTGAFALSLSPASNNNYTVAVRNGTNAMKLHVYHTGNDSTNYQRAAIQTSATEIIFAAETGGTGEDDIDVTLTPAGAGNVRFGSHSAIAAETVTGYITIKDAGGTLRKLAVVS